ncbi:MAG: toll/interleukin-1 receptor domain-containing protein [Candidatus Acidiferrum sp.]
MPILIETLRSASYRSGFTKSASTLNEARSLGLQTAFLCHSHLDAQLVEGLIVLFNEQGWRIYVDWRDVTMPETPTRQTALRIQQKIRDLRYFIFLATPNSVSSRWCPWEIGFADNEKTSDSIFIVPTTDTTGKWYGNEYLQLYRKIDVTTSGALEAWRPGEAQGERLKSLA